MARERSMSIETLAQYFSTVEDPRCSGKVEHRLIDVLVIAVCAVIACAESWDDIALYGRSKLAWLKTFLELPNGIPSHDTFRRVFMLIDPSAFETGFAPWVGALTTGFEREVVAIDGKTIRRSFEHGREPSPLHVVSAWASEQGLVLGQRCVDGKSNEITAVPELLDQLALENSIVTLDAMGCQTAIAEKILQQTACKLGHPLLYGGAEDLMAGAYSTDLRERVLVAVEAGEPADAVAEQFMIARSSAYRWLAAARDEGRRIPKPMGGGPKPIIRDEIAATLCRLLEENNHLTLVECRDHLAAETGVRVNPWTIGRALRRLDWT